MHIICLLSFGIKVGTWDKISTAIVVHLGASKIQLR